MKVSTVKTVLAVVVVLTICNLLISFFIIGDVESIKSLASGSNSTTQAGQLTTIQSSLANLSSDVSSIKQNQTSLSGLTLGSSNKAGFLYLSCDGTISNFGGTMSSNFSSSCYPH